MTKNGKHSRYGLRTKEGYMQHTFFYFENQGISVPARAQSGTSQFRTAPLYPNAIDFLGENPYIKTAISGGL